MAGGGHWVNDIRRVKLSKFLSFALRHHPEQVGIKLQPGGWIGVETLLAACRRHGWPLARIDLMELVEEADKPRFSFDPSGCRLRANYGHSLQVDLDLKPQQPPEELFHGTAWRSLASIRQGGLKPGERQFLHLSTDRRSAEHVGARHGRPVVLLVKAGQLARQGQAFYRPARGTWLTASVAADAIDSPDWT